MRVTTLSLTIAALAGAAAHAQTPGPLTNAGFETLNQFSGSGEPLGWHNLSNPTHAKRRTNGDGLFPEVLARTGVACIEIDTPGNGDFRGFTTDTVNFTSPGFPYYDPQYDWNGGDILVTGWYMIPTDSPIVGDYAAIKLNVKLNNQDYDTLDTFFNGPRIQGTTNGEWVQYSVRWTQESIHTGVNYNDTFGCDGTGEPGSGCFPGGLPPYPNHCKITIGRFGFDAPASSGVIYWDDMTYAQVPPEGCPADFDGDGTVDFFDYDAFVVCFEDPDCTNADFDGDGTVDFFDYDAFVVAFETPCP
ncbi:MAG: hypothetical protein AABZ53_05030 [Planctomycetota bacterium]